MGKKKKKKNKSQVHPSGALSCPRLWLGQFNSFPLSSIFTSCDFTHRFCTHRFSSFSHDTLGPNNHLDPSITGNILNYSSVVQIPFVISLLWSTLNLYYKTNLQCQWKAFSHAIHKIFSFVKLWLRNSECIFMKIGCISNRLPRKFVN